MQNPSICNKSPFHLMFELPDFYIFQSNYNIFNEIVFTEHTTKSILENSSMEYKSLVAVFKVKPKLNAVQIAEEYHSKKAA